MSLPSTLGELRRSPYSEQRLRTRRVKDELRDNLIAKLRNDEPLFAGMKSDNAALHRAFESARNTVGVFLQLCTQTQHANSFRSFKVRLRDNALSAKLKEDRYVFIWVHNVYKKDGEFCG